MSKSKTFQSNPILSELKGRDFLQLADFTREEILALLDLAHEMKANRDHPKHLAGQKIALIFQKSSTRTRVSFETGVVDLGAHPLFLSSNDLQLGRGETIYDTAKVMSRYVDAIMIRANSHAEVLELAKEADIPVINGLTDLYHPCQIMADLMTIQEQKGELKGLKFAYIGDGNNVAQSLMVGGAKVGMDVHVACPAGYEPNPEITKLAQTFAQEIGSEIVVTNDPVAAVRDADIVCTDTWISMGQEAEQAERLAKFQGFQVDSDLVAHAKADYIFMHCLPAYRGKEMTAEIIDGPHSVVFDEAENRLHAQKAVMAVILSE